MPEAAAPALPERIDGPFGAAALIETLPVHHLVQMYLAKVGVDVSRCFGGLATVGLYRCEATGTCFWRPAAIAGDEAFYQAMSAAWPSYYKPWRWEYDEARRIVAPGERVLEVGCGQGYFLQALEPVAGSALGLEYNAQAIRDKVTRYEVRQEPVEALARSEAGGRDVVFSFQVLEHVTEPAAFLRACSSCLAPGGRLVVSVPNFDYPDHAARRDAFDLPPHHVNHFTPAAMAKVGEQLGLRLVATHLQPRPVQLEPVHAATARSLPYRLAARGASLALGAAYRWAGEPGHTMLCVYRRA